MKTTSVAFIMSLLIAAALTPMIRELAIKFGLLDDHNVGRKVHTRPIPRLGGIAIVIAYYAPLAALFLYETDLGRRFWAQETRATGLFLGGGIIALLGFYDDLYGTRASTKFVVQFAVAALMYYMGFRIDVIANPFGPVVDLAWFGLPFTLLWIVGVINAMNLIDGIDGLAGGVALFASGTLFVLSLTRHDPLLMLFTATLGGAIIGFLFYNFNPATIFMGDTGSMFLGFILATTSIMTAQKSSTAVAMLIPIVALGLPILDTLWALTRRAARGHPLFRADRDHIHHRLLTLGLTQRQTALVLYAVCLAFAVTAWMLTWANSAQSALLLAWLGVMAFLFMRKLGYFPFLQAQMLLSERRRNRALLGDVGRIKSKLLSSRDADELWEQVKGLAEQLGVDGLSLQFAYQLSPGEVVRTNYCLEGDGIGLAESPFVAEYKIPGKGTRAEAVLCLTYLDGRSEMLHVDDSAAERLCDHITAAFTKWERDESVTPLGPRPVSGVEG